MEDASEPPAVNVRDDDVDAAAVIVALIDVLSSVEVAVLTLSVALFDARVLVVVGTVVVGAVAVVDTQVCLL